MEAELSLSRGIEHGDQFASAQGKHTPIHWARWHHPWGTGLLAIIVAVKVTQNRIAALKWIVSIMTRLISVGHQSSPLVNRHAQEEEVATWQPSGLEPPNHAEAPSNSANASILTVGGLSTWPITAIILYWSWMEGGFPYRPILEQQFLWRQKLHSRECFRKGSCRNLWWVWIPTQLHHCLSWDCCEWKWDTADASWCLCCYWGWPHPAWSGLAAEGLPRLEKSRSLNPRQTPCPSATVAEVHSCSCL